MKQIQLTLPDGSVRQYPSGTTALDVAASIGKRLANDALAAQLDGQVIDLSRAITQDAAIKMITPTSAEALEVIRHSTAHLLAQAIKDLYPDAQITIGPVIEDGFYYDVDFPKPLQPEALETIEKRMHEIAKQGLKIERKELQPKAAIELFRSMKELYKIELIESFDPKETVSAYQQGDFIDLCRGPHVPNTARLGHFKLLSLAGAYWRGDEKNKMLQRIYGTAWANEKQLNDYLFRLDEARKRDHRKLGAELELFTFLPIAPAMPFFLPNGAMVYNLLTGFMRKELLEKGYQEVICPQLMSTELWKTSGHMDHYSENMFFVKEDGPNEMALKPMNCPGHVMLFRSTKHSYRDLPIRFAEFSKLHRNERAGVTHGILRVRNFSQDDGHIFCAPEQIKDEVKSVVEHTFQTYKRFDFEVDVKLATRPDEFMGTVESWDHSIKALEGALTEANIPFTIAPKEGAFYGPKVEFHVRDSLGRSWQCGTIQLDSNLPERFDINYVDSDGKNKRPIMIHRAILGSVERFMGILIEHYAGHLPLWLSPTQVTILNVTQDQVPYCEAMLETMQSWGLRAVFDSRNEKLSYKIREAQVKRIPWMIVIGQKEVEGNTLTARKTSGENLSDLTLDGFRKVLEPQLIPGGKAH